MSELGKYFIASRAKGLLIDVNGVLFNASSVVDGTPIAGSIDALKRLDEYHIPYRLCSNESQNTKKQLVEKLNRLGFQVDDRILLTPAPLVVQELKRRNLRPYLLVHSKLKSEFSDLSTENPNCVVVGDASYEFTYDNMNNAFQVLMHQPDSILISLGDGKFYMDVEGLMLDLGAYTKALEYATGKKAHVFGKPTTSYFQAALNDMNLMPDEVLMIGDDIHSDIDGSQKCGMKGILVKTGKWRPEWINHPTIKPTGFADNFASFVDEFLKEFTS